MKWFVLIFLLLLIPSVSSLMLEQKIDILNLPYSTTSTSWTPTNGVTGIVELNLSKYDNISAIYYETTSEYDYLGIPNGIGCGSVGLYDMTNGVQITNATVGVGGGEGFHSSGTNLSYLWSNPNIQVTPNAIACASSLVKIYSARVVIIQEGIINKTRTYIPIGMGSGTTANCNGGAPDPENIYPKKWKWNDTDFGGTVSITHGGTIYRAGGVFGTRVAYANIANTTNDVPGSQISTSNTVPTWVTAVPTVDLLDEGDYYGTLCKSLFATSAIEANAFIIVDQEGTAEDMNFTLIYQMENTQRKVTTGTPAYDNTQQTQYNGSRIQGYNQEKTTFDCTFKTQVFNGSQYAFCRPKIGSTQLFSAIVSTTSTSAIEVRNIFDFSSYESNDDTIQSAIWNLDSGTQTVVWSARLIIKINGEAEPPAFCWADYGGMIYIPTGCTFYENLEDYIS